MRPKRCGPPAPSPRGLRRRALHGFTLVELLVVIGIIATLMTLLLPAVQMAREAGRRAACLNNLKQLALAVEAHKTALGFFPTGGWSSNWIGDPARGFDWRQPGGWCFNILPYMEATNLYTQASTLADRNQLVSTNQGMFVCPTRRGTGVLRIVGTAPGGDSVNISGASGWLRTDYAGNRGAVTHAVAGTPNTDPPATDTARSTSFVPHPAGASISWMAGTVTLTATSSGTTGAWRRGGSQDLLVLQDIANAVNVSQLPPNGAVSVPTAGVIHAASMVLPVAVRDGFANTYLIGEKYVPQAQYATGDNPGDDQCAYVGECPDNVRGGQRPPERDTTPWPAGNTAGEQDILAGVFGGPHQGGFNTAMCDGSVRSIDFDIDMTVHFLLAARADRQTVQAPD